MPMHLSPGYQCDIGLFQVKLDLELTSQVMTGKFISDAKRSAVLYHYGASSHNVTAAMLVSQTNEMALMLVFQTNPTLFICERFSFSQ